jgi:NitT/TauT family transport system ATP-binding protein
VEPGCAPCPSSHAALFQSLPEPDGGGTLHEGFFLDLLHRGFSAEEARRQLDTAIDWGRYGELFEYDAETGKLVLGSDTAKVGA